MENDAQNVSNKTKFRKFIKVQLLLMFMCVFLFFCVSIYEVFSYVYSSQLCFPSGPNIPSEAPCVPKCCPLNESFDPSANFTCVREGHALSFFKNVSLYKLDPHTTGSVAFHLGARGVFILPGRQVCQQYRGFEPDALLLTNGQVLINEESFVGVNGYCIEIVNDFEDNPKIFSRKQCGTIPVGLFEFLNPLLAEYLLFWSLPGCFFCLLSLIPTLIAYALLPELQNTQGKIVMSYLVTYIVAYTTLFINLLCYLPFIRFFEYYAELTTCTWNTILCWDLWLAFSRSFQKPRPGNCRFIYYSMFAWLYPMVAILILAFLPTELIGSNVFTLHGLYADFFYYHFIILLNTLNAVITISTLINLRLFHFKKHVSVKTDSFRSTANFTKGSFNFYLKLTMVMGIQFFIDQLIFIYETKLNNNNYYASWFFSQCIDVFSNTSMFVLLICNKRVLALLYKRFWSEQSQVI